MKNNLGFAHKYLPQRDPSSAYTLVLFHGTGGDEESLIHIGSLVFPESGLLSPRGKVLEKGMPRFFRRFSEGVFDLEDMKIRTAELFDFIHSASNAYGFDTGKLSALGYSNGANIAASIILTFPSLFKNAVLFHPMIPFTPENLPDLSGTRILITAGTNDPVVKPEESEGLKELFQHSGAVVEMLWSNKGHSLTQEEVERARTFFHNY